MKLSLEAMTEAWTRYWFKPIPPFWLAACRVIVGLQLYAYLRVREPEDFSSSLVYFPRCRTIYGSRCHSSDYSASGHRAKAP